MPWYYCVVSTYNILGTTHTDYFRILLITITVSFDDEWILLYTVFRLRSSFLLKMYENVSICVVAMNENIYIYAR